MRKIVLIVSFYLFFNNLHSLELKGEFYQGNLIIGKTEPGSQIFIDKSKIKVSEDGYFAFGLSKDRKNNVVIKVVNQNKTEEIIKKVYKKKISNSKNRRIASKTSNTSKRSLWEN